MTKPDQINEIWETNNPNLVEVEDSSEVDGKYILAKVRGPAFFPNTISKNNVYYSMEAWENAISNPAFRQKLADRLVFGTIGHGLELDDEAIREDKLSHIVTNVWIDDDGIGQAEYLVLNTGPGKVLNNLLRVKSKLRVSTKAAGFFEQKRGLKGEKSVIPESFSLERIDYVIDPGYVQALPKILESLNLDSNFLTKEIKGTIMTDKVVEILEARVEELKTEKQISETAASSLQSELRTIAETHSKTSTILESYTNLGTVASIQEGFSELAQYHNIGTVHDIHEALEKGEETIDTLTSTVKDLEDALGEKPEMSEEDEETVTQYQELGSPSDVKDALTQALSLTDELAKYRELGSVDELAEVVASATKMAEDAEADALQASADTAGVSVTILSDLMSKGMSLEEAISLVSQIKNPSESNSEEVPMETPKTMETTEVPEVKEEEEEVVLNMEHEEEEEEEPKIGESMSSQLLRRTRARLTPITESNKSRRGAMPSLATRLFTSKKH